MTNIAVWLADRAEKTPNLNAVKQGDTVLTFAALNDASARVAAWLASKGVKAGDHIAMVLPNVAYFPVIYYGVLRLGAVVVPMNPLLKARELAMTWEDSQARLAFVFALFAEDAAAASQQCGTEVVLVVPGEFEKMLAGVEPDLTVAERDENDDCVIFYTSGTTGRPKGAQLTHRNIGKNVEVSVKTLFQPQEGEVIFGGLPLFHSFGQTCAMNAGVYAGSCLDLLPRFDGAEALRMVQDDKISIFMGVPTMYMALLQVPDKEKYDTSTLRLGASGGASLPVEVLKGVEEAFGFPVLEGYGLSETSPVATFNRPDVPTKPGTIGLPVEGVECKLVNLDGNEVTEPGGIGEIAVRGHNVMKGYWNNPTATAEAIKDGWFYTGDLATVDEDGYFTIVDRKKDMINRNGFNVYPREIEEVLYTHPDVAECAVRGFADPSVGEEIGALVKLREGAAVTEEELMAWLKTQLAAYKYPRKVVFGELPKGPTGKILKRSISFD